MTALAGVVRFDGGTPEFATVQPLLAAQRALGPDGQRTARSAAALFGRSLYRRLPEDIHDVQPCVVGSGRFLMVADVRLDDRNGLADVLQLDRTRAAGMADSALVALLVERRGADALAAVSGDLAIALWDSTDRRLTLLRSPGGEKPLHYHSAGGWAAFASMPQALALHPRIAAPVSLPMLAEFVADVDRTAASYFSGVARVEPGWQVVIDPGGVSARRYWEPWRPRHKAAGAREQAETLRCHLDEAVRSRLRGAGDLVATHLSSGWDSAAVTATAAGILAGRGRVAAFTSAPRAGYAGPASTGRINDESRLAGLAATRFANIDHRVLRSPCDDPLDLIAGNDVAIGEPTGHVCNNPWWTAIDRAAADLGCTVLLTGEMGNHSLSAGGAMQLADLVRNGRLVAVVREAAGLVRANELSWKGALDNGLGPFVPGYPRVRRALRGTAGCPAGMDWLSPPWRSVVAADVSARGWSGVPPRDSFAHRVEQLGRHDPGCFRKGALARWGIEERDPTADRRLVEFCLSLPGEALLDHGERRPLARRALSDRLPPELLASGPRGTQAADWHEQLSPRRVERLLRRLPAAGELLELTHLRAQLGRWPPEGWHRPEVIATYRVQLLRALSAASFLQTWTDRLRWNLRSTANPAPREDRHVREWPMAGSGSAGADERLTVS